MERTLPVKHKTLRPYTHTPLTHFTHKNSTYTHTSHTPRTSHFTHKLHAPITHTLHAPHISHTNSTQFTYACTLHAPHISHTNSTHFTYACTLHTLHICMHTPRTSHFTHTNSIYLHRVTSTMTSGGVWSMRSLSGLTPLSSLPPSYYHPATVSYSTIVPSTWDAGQDASTIRIQACEEVFVLS